VDNLFGTFGGWIVINTVRGRDVRGTKTYIRMDDIRRVEARCNVGDGRSWQCVVVTNGAEFQVSTEPLSQDDAQGAALRVVSAIERQSGKGEADASIKPEGA